MLNDRSLNALPLIPGNEDGKGRSGWHAELTLTFSRRSGRTVLAHRQHRGPLAVQRPFYPEDGICHAYLLHPPGGVVGGDQLDIDVTAEPGSQALLTTPAAGKFYRSTGRIAEQTISLRAGKEASLEWLPQETIVYDGARLSSHACIDLDADARFIGWEMLTFGRPAAGEGFNSGCADLCWRLNRSGQPSYIERMRVDCDVLASAWGFHGRPSCGTMFAYPATRADLEKARDTLANRDYFGATLVDNLLICRGLARRASDIRSLFIDLWTELRPGIVGLWPSPPRIWAT